MEFFIEDFPSLPLDDKDGWNESNFSTFSFQAPDRGAFGDLLFAFQSASERRDEVAYSGIAGRSSAPVPTTTISRAQIRRVALEIIEEALRVGLNPTRVSDTAENGMAIAFRRGALYADIEIFVDGEVAAVTSDGRGHIDAWDVHSSKLADAISKIDEYLRSVAL